MILKLGFCYIIFLKKKVQSCRNPMALSHSIEKLFEKTDKNTQMGQSLHK